MSPVPYRLFSRPDHFSTYTEEATVCDCCGQTGPAYLGPFHGEDDLEAVCDPCLRAGKLGESGAWCNDGDFGELREQLAQLRPEMKDKDLDRLLEDRISELLERTPPLATWTEFPWPILDGDWCRFEQEVGLEDLRQQAQAEGQSLESWFEEHLDPTRSEPGSAAELLALVRDGSLGDNRTYHPTGTYLFRSTLTGKALIILDRE